jgi:hypothetical protein
MWKTHLATYLLKDGTTITDRRCAVYQDDPDSVDVYIGPPAFLTRVNYCNTMKCNRAASNEAFVFDRRNVAIVCLWMAITFL